MSIEYIGKVKDIVSEIEETQADNIREVAAVISKSLGKGGILNLFGSGHSSLVAIEAFGRTGGLACINAIVDKLGGRMELLEGYAKILLDLYEPQSGEALIIISTTGINPLIVDMALEGKERGLVIVALTSLSFSKKLTSRHSSGKRLFEAADYVLDICGSYGDAEIEIKGLKQKVGPTSTAAASVILNAVITQVVQNIAEKGITPPIFMNEKLEGGVEHNMNLKKQYRERIPARHTAMLFWQ